MTGKRIQKMRRVEAEHIQQVTCPHSTELSSSQTLILLNVSVGWSFLVSRSASVLHEFWWSDWRFTNRKIERARQVTRMYSVELSSNQTFDSFECFCKLIASGITESQRIA